MRMRGEEACWKSWKVVEIDVKRINWEVTITDRTVQPKMDRGRSANV